MPPLEKIKIVARDSKLSKAQMNELLSLLPKHPWKFELHFIKTVGDKDKTVSLRLMEKTDFFTRELDQMLLSGQCRLTVHSAKDLPEPLPKGIQLVALTAGVDPSDSLVLREGESLFPGAVVATSSLRREENLKQWRPDLKFVDIRGNIEERIEQLNQKKCDGVVIAEAALIRLQLTHLNRIQVPGPTAPLQGRLAVLAREEDEEMREFFNP